MEAWLQHSKDMLNDNQDMETILSSLRKDGCSIGLSVIIWKKITGIDFYEAKVQVMYSQTWRDMKETTENLQEEAYQFLQSIKSTNEEE